MPVIIRDLDDDAAVLVMVDSNIQREELLPSERAFAYKMKLEAMKRQVGRPSKENSVPVGQNFDGKTSRELLAAKLPDSNTQIQRYVRLTELIPSILQMVDDGKIAFRPAVELSYIKPKNQRLIAVSIDGEQASPSLAQAKRLRELDKEGKLNGDVIDGILSEQKKEDRGVIISTAELEKYFGKEVTPAKMKEQIMSLLDDWKEKQPPELAKAPKKQELDK